MTIVVSKQAAFSVLMVNLVTVELLLLLLMLLLLVVR